MADIKTHLRELGVLVGIKNQLCRLGYSYTTINSNSFCSIVDSILPNSKHRYYNNIREIDFSNSDRSIIKNAFALSNAIINKLEIKMLISADWFGFNSGKEEPYDIEINGKLFSLKEDSFILENMGLYKLLNCYTGSNYKKRHIFEDYAANEYCNWFNITWDCLITYLKSNNNTWSYINPKNNTKRATISLNQNGVQFDYYEGNHHETNLLPLQCQLCTFKSQTTSHTREGVFAKFINNQLDTNSKYNEAKKQCAIVASNKLANELMQNLNYSSGIARFLRIHEHSYYYAKTTFLGVELYEVPSKDTFTSTIQITSIIGSVPDKQANILTTIKNIETNQTLVLRNECRFSHGQFNGTPEAKLYYEHGGSLEIIYKKI